MDKAAYKAAMKAKAATAAGVAAGSPALAVDVDVARPSALEKHRLFGGRKGPPPPLGDSLPTNGLASPAGNAEQPATPSTANPSPAAPSAGFGAKHGAPHAPEGQPPAKRSALASTANAKPSAKALGKQPVAKAADKSSKVKPGSKEGGKTEAKVVVPKQAGILGFFSKPAPAPVSAAGPP